MKLVELLYGVIIFSVVISLLFTLAGDFFKEGKVNDSGLYSSLAVDYKKFSENQVFKDSEIREIQGASDVGTASSTSQDIFLLTGAIQGGRLIINSIKNFDNIANNISSTVLIGENAVPSPYIDPRIIVTLKALVVVLIVIISLQFLRGFKLET